MKIENDSNEHIMVWSYFVLDYTFKYHVYHFKVTYIKLKIFNINNIIVAYNIVGLKLGLFKQLSVVHQHLQSLESKLN